MPNVIIKNLSASYFDAKDNETIVLKDVSHQFLDRKFNVIVGASGSGKTTLAKCILGLMDYDGEIYFDDLEISNVAIKDRNIAYVPQDLALYGSMSVFDNIAFPLKVAHASVKEQRERVLKIAKELQIDHCLSRKPKQLSIGQCQRVAIARALVKNPSLIIMDEPLSNIDPLLRKEIITQLKDIKDKYNCTFIYITHNINEAINLGDNITVIDDGNIVMSDEPKKIMESDNPVIKVSFYEGE